MILKDPILLAQVPDYSDYIDNKLYDTEKSELLAYTIKDGCYDMDGRIGGKGIFFDGLYKTKNGNYFWYEYQNEKRGEFFGLFGKLYDNRRKIIKTYSIFPLKFFKTLYFKFINIEDEIKIIDA